MSDGENTDATDYPDDGGDSTLDEQTEIETAGDE